MPKAKSFPLFSFSFRSPLFFLFFFTPSHTSSLRLTLLAYVWCEGRQSGKVSAEPVGRNRSRTTGRDQILINIENTHLTQPLSFSLTHTPSRHCIYRCECAFMRSHIKFREQPSLRLWETCWCVWPLKPGNDWRLYYVTSWLRSNLLCSDEVNYTSRSPELYYLTRVKLLFQIHFGAFCFVICWNCTIEEEMSQS